MQYVAATVQFQKDPINKGGSLFPNQFTSLSVCLPKLVPKQFLMSNPLCRRERHKKRSSPKPHCPHNVQKKLNQGGKRKVACPLQLSQSRLQNASSTFTTR